MMLYYKYFNTFNVPTLIEKFRAILQFSRDLSPFYCAASAFDL